MPRRGDNIRKRKDGRWEARYSNSNSIDCAKSYKSVYGKTYREAKEKRDAIIAQGQTSQAKATTITFRELLKSWQASNQIRLKKASVSRYQNLIDTHILPALGDKRMDQISTELINRFLTAKLQYGRLNHTGGLSPSYVRSIALVINSAMVFGASANLCAPIKTAIVKPTIPKKELSVLSEKNQTILEAELLKDITEEKLLIYITLYTGIRIGEACALRWEDVNLTTKTLHIRRTVSRVWHTENGIKASGLVIDSPKTETSLRCIPICSKLYAVLCSFPYRKQYGYVLTSKTSSSFISPRTFEYQYKLVLKKCALESINYHALRHTFATRCIERGVDIKSLSEILGHSDVSITLNTYVHSSMELKMLQLEKLVS